MHESRKKKLYHNKYSTVCKSKSCLGFAWGNHHVNSLDQLDAIHFSISLLRDAHIIQGAAYLYKYTGTSTSIQVQVQVQRVLYSQTRATSQLTIRPMLDSASAYTYLFPSYYIQCHVLCDFPYLPSFSSKELLSFWSLHWRLLKSHEIFSESPFHFSSRKIMAWFFSPLCLMCILLSCCVWA